MSWTPLTLPGQKLVLLGGLPGSGKSTMAQQLEGLGYVRVCPDVFREVLRERTEGIEPSELGQTAWIAALAQARQELACGRSVVLDAVHQTPALRMATLQKLRFTGTCLCYYLDATYDTCAARNLQRADSGGHYVPPFVMLHKWQTQVLPSPEEGFQDVYVDSEGTQPTSPTLYHTEADLRALRRHVEATATAWHGAKLTAYLPTLARCWDVDQQQARHRLPLHAHLLTTAAHLTATTDEALYWAALLHDVGKVDTKQYEGRMVHTYRNLQAGSLVQVLEANKVGVIVRQQQRLCEEVVLVPHGLIHVDKEAHFNHHQTVGAVAARRNLLAQGFPLSLADEVYRLILHHMDLPFTLTNNMDKILQRLRRLHPPRRLQQLWELRRADKQASVMLEKDELVLRYLYPLLWSEEEVGDAHGAS